MQLKQLVSPSIRLGTEQHAGFMVAATNLVKEDCGAFSIDVTNKLYNASTSAHPSAKLIINAERQDLTFTQR